jgi:hypothetical protein
LKHFTFKCDNEDQNVLPDIQLLLTTQAVALGTLIIDSCFAHLPDSPLFMDNLRSLDLCITISNAVCLTQLLESGQQLESLQLWICLDGSAISSAFRSHHSHSGPGSFPKLRKFGFTLLEVDTDEDVDPDPDLFPAVAEFVRGHPMFEALSLSCKDNPEDFGYTAAIWGVLPSLVHLHTLSMDAPEDLSCALSGWLIPRAVVALSIQIPEGASWKGSSDVRIFHT